jgi:tetratricopeptide (TPR) repeat protein
MRAYRTCIAVLASVLLASCAYYNIYWMAKGEYQRVVRDPKFDGFWDPYNHKKVAGETARLVDSCIKRCGKLLLLYPESKWVDDTLLLMGNCFVIKGDYANAARKYDELLRLYGTSEFADEARYMKAYNLILQGSHQKAVTELDQLLGGVTKTSVREKATYLRALVPYSAGDCEEAVDHLERYISTFPGGVKVTQMRVNLGRCLVKIARYDEAIEVLRPLYEKPGPDRVPAGLRMARAYRNTDQDDRALEILDGLVAEAESDTLKVRAMIEISNTLLARQRPEEAIQSLADADTLLGGGHANLRAETAYAMGIIYEKHMLDYDAATTSYEGAAASPSKFGKLATKRAKALKDLKRYSDALTDSIPDSPEDRAMNMFLVAEIYLEDLGLTEEAYDRLTTVIDSFPTTTFAAKSMLAVGSLLDSRQDTTAMRYYRRVIDAFPGTVYGNVARRRLGLSLVDIVVEAPKKPSVVDTSAALGTAMEPAAGDTSAIELPAARDTLRSVMPPSVERLARPPAKPDTGGTVGRSGFEPFAQDTTESMEPGPPEAEGPELGPPEVPAPGPETPESLFTGEDESVADTLGSPAHQDSVGQVRP